MSELVTAPINLTDDLFLKYNDVEEIKVKHIYTINGKAPVDFIVYAYYEIYFQGISTPLPSLDEMYLTDVGGNISIINGNIMMDDYNYAVSLTRDNSGVNDLVNSVNIIFNEAINKDVTLKSKIEPLKPEIIVPDEDTGSEDD